MATNAGNATNGNGDSNLDTGFKLDNNSGYVPEEDAAFSKHLDIAIEAQDGKTTEAPNTDTKGGTEEKPKDGEQPKPEDRTGGDSDSKPQQQPNKEGAKEEKPVARAKDLTLADGTVVKGGAERRFYEQRETARQEANHYRTQLDNATKELGTVRQQLQQVQDTVQSINGADPRDVAIGVRMVTDLKSDPVGTMKKLLAEVVAQGYKIEDIGTGVDALAVQRMIDQRVAPLETESAPDEAAILREAETEAATFFSAYPDARPHDGLLARVLRDNPGVDLNTAYFQLKDSFAERGFDWSLTLEDNLKAQSSQSNGTDTQQQQPLPNGGNVQPTDAVKKSDDTSVAHEDTDMSDIIRAAMRENGLNV